MKTVLLILTSALISVQSFSQVSDKAADKIGAIDDKPKSPEGLVLEAKTLYAQTADATHPGMLSFGNQTIGGAKTFTGIITAPRLGLGLTSPTALMHMKAGSPLSGSAPLKFSAGGVLTNPEAGAMEFDGVNFYLSPSSLRQTIATNSNTLTFSNKVWNGTAIATNYGGTGLSSLGKAIQLLRVNSAANGLEYFTLTQATVPGLPDSLLIKANRNFSNVPSGAISNSKLANSMIQINGKETSLGDKVTITTSGTTKRVIVSNGSVNPKIDIAPDYVGQNSISTVGTINSGTWNGSVVGASYGGTGLSSLGSANQQLRVNASSNGLEYFTAGTNIATATALQTARTINGVAFDGTANITVTAGAGTLTGTALAASVTGSSLNSVGTITSGVWNGTAVDDGHIASAAKWNAMASTSAPVFTGTSVFHDNVGIGTSTPAEKLAVNGNIRAKEIKVEIANWPDYVFHKNYVLPDLKKTEQFINTNGHLPGIPSADEVQKDGISVGDLNARLLQKIEELTLYMIELKKELDLIKSHKDQ